MVYMNVPPSGLLIIHLVFWKKPAFAIQVGQEEQKQRNKEWIHSFIFQAKEIQQRDVDGRKDTQQPQREEKKKKDCGMRV